MTISLRHDHVGITLTAEQLDPTIAWYRDKLDFTVTDAFEAGGSSFTFLTNGDVLLELISAGAAPGRAHPESLPGSHDVERLHHFCVTVDDLDDVLAQLRDRGVEPLAGPMQIDRIGRRIAFVTDQVGTIVELSAAV